MNTKWVIGKVEQVIRSDRDQKIRRVFVKYQNEREDFGRMTDRSVRKLVKLFSIDEHHVDEDLAELQKKIDQLQDRQHDGDEEQYLEVAAEGAQDEVQNESGDDGGSEAEEQEVPDDEEPRDNQPQPQPINEGPARNTRRQMRSNCNCCCTNHCKLAIHTLDRARRAYSNPDIALQPCTLEDLTSSPSLKVISEDDDDDCECKEAYDEDESFSQLLRSTNLELRL